MRAPASFRIAARLLALVLVLAATPLQAPAAAADTTMRAADNADFQHQVLVMVRAAPTRRHAGPGYGAIGLHSPARRAGEAIARDHGLQVLAQWPMPALGVDCYVMRIGAGDDRDRVLQGLASDRRLQWAQAVQRFKVLGGGDPLYAAQPTANLWRLRELHASTTGKGVLVAEIDSGVAVDHPDLRGQLAAAQNFVPGESFVAEAHGTEVAGIISARADNGIGIAGVAPQARLMALRGCWQVADGTAQCSSYSLAQALQYALHARARVINLSLSGPYDGLLARLLEAAAVQGATVVAAVDPAVTDGGFPASQPGVLAVAPDGAVVALPKVLRAPGMTVPTTQPGDGWGMVSGSSFATAQVSGLAALLLQLSPSLRPAQLQDMLASSRRAGAALAGIDACAAVAQAQRRCACDCGAVAVGAAANAH